MPPQAHQHHDQDEDMDKQLHLCKTIFVITHLCLNFNDGSVEPPLLLECGWVINQTYDNGCNYLPMR